MTQYGAGNTDGALNAIEKVEAAPKEALRLLDVIVAAANAGGCWPE